MVKVIADDLLACSDCVQAIANDDYTGLDYYYPDPTERDAREKAIREGIANCGGYPVVGEEYGFTWQGCDICGLNLGGDKHRVVVLDDQTEPHASDCRVWINELCDCVTGKDAK